MRSVHAKKEVKDACAVCRLTFGISDRHRRQRKPGVNVHDYCILRGSEKERIIGSCRDFLLELDVAEIDVRRFAAEAEACKNPERLAGIVQSAVQALWNGTSNRRIRKRLTAFAAQMSQTLTYEVRLPAKQSSR